MTRFLGLAACAVFLLTSASQVHASISTSGSLLGPPVGAYELFNFQVNSPGIVNFELAGGASDAWLGVFSGTNVLDNSTFIAQDDDSGPGLDSFLSLNLTAGSYTAWITNHGSFWDTGSNSISTNHDHLPMDYTLTINGDVSVAGGIPEPSSAVILSLGGIGVGLAVWQRKRIAAA
jgi:hypothetical protein